MGAEEGYFLGWKFYTQFTVIYIFQHYYIYNKFYNIWSRSVYQLSNPNPVAQ